LHKKSSETRATLPVTVLPIQPKMS